MEWQHTNTAFFTGAVYLTDVPGAVTHFLAVSSTMCGLEVKEFLPASHAIITCPDCSKQTFYFKSGEIEQIIGDTAQ